MATHPRHGYTSVMKLMSKLIIIACIAFFDRAVFAASSCVISLDGPATLDQDGRTLKHPVKITGCGKNGCFGKLVVTANYGETEKVTFTGYFSIEQGAVLASGDARVVVSTSHWEAVQQGWERFSLTMHADDWFDLFDRSSCESKGNPNDCFLKTDVREEQNGPNRSIVRVGFTPIFCPPTGCHGNVVLDVYSNWWESTGRIKDTKINRFHTLPLNVRFTPQDVSSGTKWVELPLSYPEGWSYWVGKISYASHSCVAD